MAEPGSYVRALVELAASQAREQAEKIPERASEGLGVLMRELGFVTRGEYEELELRLAQVEHRLRLLEREEATPPA